MEKADGEQPPEYPQAREGVVLNLYLFHSASGRAAPVPAQCESYSLSVASDSSVIGWSSQHDACLSNQAGMVADSPVADSPAAARSASSNAWAWLIRPPGIDASALRSLASAETLSFPATS